LFGHQATLATTRQGALEATQHSAPWSSSDVLANRLAGAKTRLAVFNACNSGLWPFMRPLMRAGIPAAIGVQGLVSNIAALNFTEKFYQSLAVGLSLDEALTYARLYLLQPGRADYPCDWGRFMAYMPADSAVIFPRPMIPVIRERQQELRVGRNEALKATLAITAELDGQGVSRVLSEVASRSVLILGRFTASRKPVLDLLRQDLSTSPNRYIPILFDFDGTPDRTMIESVLGFAAVSRFVIADLSDPKWVLAELQQIVSSLRSVPVVPIIHESQREDEVIAHFASYSCVHPVIRYRDPLHLHAILDTEVLGAAEAMYGDMKPRAVFT
jgi:hypothetical protein